MSQTERRVLFMGTGDIAIPAFKGVIDCERYNLVALVTQPDKPVGRKQQMTPPLIKKIAEEFGVPVLQPEKVKQEADLEMLRQYQADVIVVMAYGQMLPNALLEMPKVACINLHASLLPLHRGASCIQAAIDQGDAESGVTVMHVIEKLDAGDVILRKPFKLTEGITGGELHDRLADDGPGVLLEALDQLFDGTAQREKQMDEQSSYAPKLMRQHGEIDWTMSAEQIERRVRAYDPWPGTSSRYYDIKGRSRRIKVFPPVSVRGDVSAKPGEVVSTSEGLVVACGKGGVLIETVQPEGSRKMSAADFLLGGHLNLTDILG